MISFALVVIAIRGALRGESIWEVMAPMALVTTCTQLGYVIALLVLEGSHLWGTFKAGEGRVIGDEPGNTDNSPKTSGKAVP